MQHETKGKQEIEAAKNLIIETLDGDSIHRFDSFEDFYGWFDTTLHYDQHDTGESLADSYQTLKSAYQDLVNAQEIKQGSSADNSERGSIQQSLMVSLEPFDYDNPPDSGVYWVIGRRQLCDGDAADDGQTVGWLTGETQPFSAAVQLEVYADGEVEFSPLEAYELGSVDPATDVVTHVAPIRLPSPAIAAEEPQL